MDEEVKKFYANTYAYLSDDGTMGELNNPREWLKKFKRIGGLDIELLKKIIKKMPKKSEIGIYICKKDCGRIKKGMLAPIHNNAWILAPTIDSETPREFENYE